MDQRLQGLLDPSDLVQQTLLRAHQKREQCRGQTDAERATWLRAILATELGEVVRKFDRRGEGRRQSFEERITESAMRLEERLQADSTSPDRRAERHERLLLLADALATLPDDQRTAVELRSLQELPVREVAARMHRSSAAVAGLLRRGLAALRGTLGELHSGAHDA
jgi:RNA polymerase sigma-70 factor (ECF subfamily)